MAARIAAIDHQLGLNLGLNKDRTALNDPLNRAAKQFTDGARFATPTHKTPAELLFPEAWC